jgi:hypothetical protein
MICEVGVFDLDKPWEWFTVTTCQAIVTNLRWDKTGVRLLITDSNGLCQVWQMQVDNVGRCVYIHFFQFSICDESAQHPHK